MSHVDPALHPKTMERNPGGTAVLPLVLRDMAMRIEMGMEKYGQALMTNDGRDPLVDAYQEVLDLAMYLRKAIWERDGA